MMLKQFEGRWEAVEELEGDPLTSAWHQFWADCDPDEVCAKITSSFEFSIVEETSTTTTAAVPVETKNTTTGAEKSQHATTCQTVRLHCDEDNGQGSTLASFAEVGTHPGLVDGRREADVTLTASTASTSVSADHPPRSTLLEEEDDHASRASEAGGKSELLAAELQPKQDGARRNVDPVLGQTQTALSEDDESSEDENAGEWALLDMALGHGKNMATTVPPAVAQLVRLLCNTLKPAERNPEADALLRTACVKSEISVTTPEDHLQVGQGSSGVGNTGPGKSQVPPTQMKTLLGECSKQLWYHVFFATDGCLVRLQPLTRDGVRGFWVRKFQVLPENGNHMAVQEYVLSTRGEPSWFFGKERQVTYKRIG
ncbi:unnamed protein product [Amoebophrya sp. A120]|nr:unnamed protein product [Amoebophrya sp. A120]|eukprot:GSA120T00024019001.1